MKRGFTIFFTFLVLLSFTLADEHINAAEQNDCLYYFYGENCPTCQETNAFIDNLHQTYPNLQLERFEIYSGFSEKRASANRELLESYFNAFNVNREDQGIPALFTNQIYLIGYSAISEYAEQQILDNPSSSCPSVGQRSVIGVVGEQSPVTLLETLTFPVIIGSGINDFFSYCTFVLVALFIGFLFISLRRKVMSRATLFLFGSFVVQFLLGLSSFAFSGLLVLYSVLGILALLAGIQIVMLRLKGKDILSKLVTIPQGVKHILSQAQQGLTSPPGALIAGAASTMLLAGCHGTNYVLLSSLIVRESSIKPVLLLFTYIIMILLPFLIIVFFLRRYMKTVTEENEGRLIKKLELWIGWGLIILGILTVLAVFL